MTLAVRALWAHRRILLATTLGDVKSRFKGTLLGPVWVILYPLLFLSLYAVIYTFVFKIRLPEYETFDYVLLIFCGLVPFIGFAEALAAGTTSVSSNKALVKNTLFPIELIPAKAVLSSSVTMTVGLFLLLGTLWFRGIVHTTQWLLPVIFLLQLVFTVGLLWLLSSINVFVPDLGQMIGIVTLFLMLVSPIAYTREMIPSELMPIMYPNPLYYLIFLYRDAAFVGKIDAEIFTLFSVMSFSMLIVGGFVFSRLKSIFSDYV